jgi:streptogramin lyase
VRLLDASTGLGVGHRIAVGVRPTAIVTDDRGAWVLDSATERLYRVFPP